MTVARNIELAEQRTLLDVERTFIVFERALMAWLWTSFASLVVDLSTRTENRR